MARHDLAAVAARSPARYSRSSSCSCATSRCAAAGRCERRADAPRSARSASGRARRADRRRGAVEARRVERGDALRPLPAASSSCGWKPWPSSRTRSASWTRARRSGVTSRSCGSTPGGVRFSTRRPAAHLGGRERERIEGGDHAAARLLHAGEDRHTGTASAGADENGYQFARSASLGTWHRPARTLRPRGPGLRPTPQRLAVLGELEPASRTAPPRRDLHVTPAGGGSGSGSRRCTGRCGAERAGDVDPSPTEPARPPTGSAARAPPPPRLRGQRQPRRRAGRLRTWRPGSSSSAPLTASASPRTASR